MSDSGKPSIEDNGAEDTKNDAKPHAVVSDKVKTNFGSKHLKIAAILVVAVFAALLVAYWFTREAKVDLDKHYQKITDKMEKSQLDNDQTKVLNELIEVESLKGQKKYTEAKTKLETIIASNKNEATLQKAYVAYGQVCIELQDIACIDKVIEYTTKNNSVDIYFVIEAAEMTKSINNLEKSQSYYKLALEKIDKSGGTNYVKKLNEESQQKLDYAAIKRGAGV